MADGGSINLRLSLRGAEQVRAELDKIGPAGAKMGRELDRALRTPGPGLQALNAGVSAGRSNLEGFASRAGVVGTGLQQLGGWGLAAAAGVAAVGVSASFAIDRLREAMTFAADLTDTAGRIGANVESLQAWRYVADEAGVSVEGFQSNLEKLNGTLGRVKAGIGDARLKPWLEELGITPESLDTISTAEEMMILLADRLGGIADRSKQVAAARAFGVEDSLPILRLGADRVRELMEEARSLGLVLNQETIVALDEADRAVERAAQRIESEMRFAVSGLADDFANLVTQIANALQKLNEFLNGMGGADAKMQAMYGFGLGDLASAGFDPIAIGRLGLRAGGAVLSGRTTRVGNAWNAPQDSDDPALVRQQMAITAREQANAPTGEMLGHTSASGGARPSDRDAERRRNEAQREIERLDRTEISAQREWIQSVIGRADTAASREEVARQLRDLDDREFEAQLTKVEETITAGELMTAEVQARIDMLRDLRADAQAGAAAEEAERAQRERDDALKSAEDQHLQITSEILSMAASTARTAGERQDVEMALLEISQRRQRADLQAAIQAEKEPEARARLVEALERLPGLFTAQVADVRRRTAGPLEQWRDSQLQGAGEASEWLQGQAIDALDGVNAGLIDTWRNADNAGDALARMGQVGVDALGRIADAMLEVALQRMVIQPLTNALFGGAGGSGSAGLLGNLFGAFSGSLFGSQGLPTTGAPSVTPGAMSRVMSRGLARGGVNGAAGWTPVGELGMEIVDLPVGSRVHDADRTQRTLLDFDARMRSLSAHTGGAPTVNMPIHIINRTSEPVTARQSRMAGGGYEVILESAVRSTVGRMGADGTLAKAHQSTPRGTRR